MQRYFTPFTLSFHILPCITLSLISGIMWIHYQGTWVTSTALLGGIAFFSYHYSFPVADKKLYSSILAIIAFLIGVSQYQRTSQNYAIFFNSYSHIISLEGEITAIDRCHNKHFKYFVTLKSHVLQSETHKTYAPYDIHIYTGKKPECEIGDIVYLENINFKKPTNSDFLLYLKKESISATLFLPHIPLKVVYRPTFSIKKLCSTFKNNLIASLRHKLSPLAFSLFLTIFLGKKSSHKKSIRHACKVWGISHYLARSGLHLLIFMILLKLVLNIACMGYRLQSFLLISLGGLYYILSWPSVSFNRAFFAFILEKCSALALVSVPSYHILNVVCFFTLLYNPYHLFFLDFQLSFSLALTLAYFNELSRQKQCKHPQKAYLS